MPITHWNGSHHRILLFLTDGQILLLVLKLSCCRTQDDGTEMHGHKRAALGGKRNVRWEPVRKGGHQPVMHPQRIDFYLCMFGRNFYAMNRNTTWQIPWLSSSDILSKWPRFRHVKFLTRENWDITHFSKFLNLCHLSPRNRQWTHLGILFISPFLPLLVSFHVYIIFILISFCEFNRDITHCAIFHSFRWYSWSQLG